MAHEKCRQLKLDVLKQGYTAECHSGAIMRIVGDILEHGSAAQQIVQQVGYSAEQFETAQRVALALKPKKVNPLFSPFFAALQGKKNVMQEVHLYMLRKGDTYAGYVFSYPTDTPEKGTVL